MRNISSVILLSCLTLCSFADAKEHIHAQDAAKAPNIVLIVADDLGMADLKRFGGEIPTPNLDALAQDSVVLNNFYTAPTCSPTRAMLLSGQDNHIAGLGSMKEFMLKQAPELMKKPGYEGHLVKRFPTLAESLKESGYSTFMAGKWHLGSDDGFRPHDRGFDHSFSLMEGGSSHLDRWGINFKSGDATYYKDDNKASVPADFYSTVFYTDTMIDYLANRNTDKPFMAYLAYTAPHWPLQAPGSSIEPFKGKYDEGYEVLYNRRFEKQKALGLVGKEARPAPLPDYIPRWDSLSPEEQKRSSKSMEIYAAMVSDLDREVGRFISYLKADGEYENTVVLFISDNGAEDGTLDKFKMFMPVVNKCCDTSTENMGRKNSFVMYGPGWARVSNGLNAKAKGTTGEGGIKSPAFIKLAEEKDIPETDQVISVMDVMPTILDIAGVEQKYHMQAQDFTGRSFLRALTDNKRNERPLGWELFDNKAYRNGDWKIASIQGERGDGQWHLYNLRNDPQELEDVKSQFPEIFDNLKADWQHYAKDAGVQVLNTKLGF